MGVVCYTGHAQIHPYIQWHPLPPPTTATAPRTSAPAWYILHSAMPCHARTHPTCAGMLCSGGRKPGSSIAASKARTTPYSCLVNALAQPSWIRRQIVVMSSRGFRWSRGTPAGRRTGVSTSAGTRRAMKPSPQFPHLWPWPEFECQVRHRCEPQTPGLLWV